MDDKYAEIFPPSLEILVIRAWEPEMMEQGISLDWGPQSSSSTDFLLMSSLSKDVTDSKHRDGIVVNSFSMLLFAFWVSSKLAKLKLFD